MNILVIDSDRVSRRLAALLLARLGCPPPVLIDDAASLPAGDWSLVLVGEHIAAPSLRDALGAHTRLVIMAAQDSDETHRAGLPRSEEHTSELQSLMRIWFACFCLNKDRIPNYQ